MERTIDPVFLAIRDTFEPELDRLGFRIALESHQYDAFGSESLEYARRGARLRLQWDGKDRWAWVTVARQPSAAFPDPATYRDIDADFAAPNAVAPRLNTREAGVDRANEMLMRLSTALNEILGKPYAV